MKTDANSLTGLNAARHIANLVGRCPLCDRAEYVALIENANIGFRLLALRCEHCNTDIISEYDCIAEPNLPRSAVAPRYSLLTLVLMAVCVVLAGATGVWIGWM